MKRTCVRRTALAFACAGVLLACGARAADLLSVVDSALDRDPRLAASRDGYRAAMQAVPKARAALLPHVTGGWGRAYNGIVTQDFPTQHYWQSGWTVGLVQPIFDWSSWTAYRQADLIAVRGRLETASATQDTILAAAQAYFDALAAADEAARAADYLRALDAHLALVARAKAAGEATLVDVREGESSRAQAQLQWLDAQSQVRLARSALERVSGETVTMLAPLPPDSAPALEPQAADPWITQAQTRGYAVQLGEVALQIAKYETEKARAGHYPSVDLQVTHTPAGAAGGFSKPTTTTTGMLQIVIPLYSGGETAAKVEEARALEDKTRDELGAAVRDAGADARENWLRVVQGQAHAAALDQLVQREQAALEATRNGFSAGSRTSLDVLRATEALYASRRDQIRARYDTAVALLKLLAQASILDLDEVARINAQLFATQPTQGAHPTRGATTPSPISALAGLATSGAPAPDPVGPAPALSVETAVPRALPLRASDMAPAAPTERGGPFAP